MIRGFVTFIFLLAPMFAYACPDLGPYYGNDRGPEEWARLEQKLAPLMTDCLQNAEYFALYGAALLNSGQVPDALDALERALLLEPDHGGAQIDYAQALYTQGQVFTAIDLNEQVLERDDLPPELEDMLQARQARWRGNTRETSVQVDMLAGYDNNLNGAPAPDQITLTLSGEPVLLTLDPQFRPVSGPYLNLRLAGNFRQLGPSHHHDLLLGARGRLSEDRDSDLLQIDGRYQFQSQGEGHDWNLEGGVSNLFFGGSPLFTATDGTARYQSTGDSCGPFYEAALQHQHYHNQTVFNALESRASAGLGCPVAGGRQRFGAELGLLYNHALKPNRPGGDREGWQFRANWQGMLAGGVLAAQFSYTRMDDKEGYSDLLAGGAPRDIRRTSTVLQYRRPLNQVMALLFNFSHQRQGSNIDLFEYSDTSAEIGFSLSR